MLWYLMYLIFGLMFSSVITFFFIPPYVCVTIRIYMSSYIMRFGLWIMPEGDAKHHLSTILRYFTLYMTNVVNKNEIHNISLDEKAELNYLEWLKDSPLLK